MKRVEKSALILIPMRIFRAEIMNRLIRLTELGSHFLSKKSKNDYLLKLLMIFLSYMLEYEYFKLSCIWLDKSRHLKMSSWTLWTLFSDKIFSKLWHATIKLKKVKIKMCAHLSPLYWIYYQKILRENMTKTIWYTWYIYDLNNLHNWLKLPPHMNYLPIILIETKSHIFLELGEIKDTFIHCGKKGQKRKVTCKWEHQQKERWAFVFFLPSKFSIRGFLSVSTCSLPLSSSYSAFIFSPPHCFSSSSFPITSPPFAPFLLFLLLQLHPCPWLFIFSSPSISLLLKQLNY